mmetsp:Transcript_6068/g.18338  ORF Transcript_6068/g.18338 Transcript_6068/m.18338 type:complete len:185 (-) Transcript_6068:114-668(-)
MAFVGSAGGVVGRAQRGALCVQRPKGTQKNMRRTRVEMVAAGSIEEAWSTLAQKMRDQDESASTEEWNELISFAVAKDDLEKAVYFLELMKKTGRKPQASTYDVILKKCAKSIATREKEIAFYLVEQMYADKVSLGDVTLPKKLGKHSPGTFASRGIPVISMQLGHLLGSTGHGAPALYQFAKS